MRKWSLPKNTPDVTTILHNLLPCKLNFFHFTYSKILFSKWQFLKKTSVCNQTQKVPSKSKRMGALEVLASTSKYRCQKTCPAKQVFACDLSVQLVLTWLSQKKSNCFFSPCYQSVQMFIFTETLETRGVQKHQQKERTLWMVWAGNWLR